MANFVHVHPHGPRQMDGKTAAELEYAQRVLEAALEGKLMSLGVDLSMALLTRMVNKSLTEEQHGLIERHSQFRE